MKKFPYQNTYEKKYSEGLSVFEYEDSPFQMNGAIAHLDEAFGPKINKTFTELFYMVDGEMDVEANGESVTLIKDDVYIAEPGKPHKLIGRKAKVFIVCNPPFDPSGLEMVEEK
ncbi:cupin domain-containing protein [Pseudomonadota bacterium]